MIPFTPAAIPELTPWGSVADLGAEILEGACQTSGKMDFGAPTDPVSSAYFGVTKGIFRMVYPFDEHAVVLEGEITLTNEATGERHTFRPGEGWFVKKGTPVLWTISSERFVKHYFAVA